MPRRARQIEGGMVYHVLNRACGRMKLFSRDGDYEVFEKLLREALARVPIRLLCYCLMPNHWHFVVWPRESEQVSQFMFWLTLTHVKRWRHSRHLVGLGPLYQNRFKSFPVESDRHFLVVCRYVERNPLRARLVKRAEHWRWSSLHVRMNPDPSRMAMLHPWPVDMASDWVRWVNDPQTEKEVQSLRSRIRSGRPFGSPSWERRTALRMGFAPEPGKAGRPRGANPTNGKIDSRP